MAHPYEYRTGGESRVAASTIHIPYFYIFIQYYGEFF